ncbi:uncharacterized protein DUF805 [Vibrio diazotrophicus]|jgi:uncharacterized membrane protein YhaH (DUF805 family)|uniref:Uncharacterized protein DUF805 n=2 Tax=Vibrio diazotrophicus TaxID=685 RepID=A0A329ECZ0_VIBDI|nr:uncharacterized protein DUF805 [Vibrio diazotrophicus]
MILGFVVGVNRLFPGLASLILPVFLLLILIPDLAITAKRWHDRDKNSWWLLLNIPLVIGRMSVPVGANALTANEPMLYETIISVAALICGSWILIECGFMKGTHGDNRFGKEPV